jgi:hypothetical protein
VVSCQNFSSEEKELYKMMGKKLNLDMLDVVYHKGETVEVNTMLDRYKHFSVIYLQYGCEPCYPKYIDWHKKLDSLVSSDSYTAIFIIEGNHYSTYQGFITEVLKIDSVNDHFYTFIDTGFKFLDGNKDIPFWIIENSLLIDRKSRIKLIGNPFITLEMKELFFKIIL